jgi:two-component system, NarL family, sensor histidine kinase DegS
VADQLARLAADLGARRSIIQRELDEIELLMRQARTEADRHAARRQAAGERLTALLDRHEAPAELRQAHEQLMLQYERSAMMSAQIEVLEGKQRVLQRMRSGLEEIAAAVGAQTGPATPGEAVGPPGEDGPGPAQTPTRVVLDAQEEMRRAIARQMHDGPAQSIANIALQAEIVQRLVGRDQQAAEHELAELRSMVQHALDATKSFIFDVRPMVLDDLGLVPTLRRAAGERERRSNRPVRFESVGPVRRLEPRTETQLFRIIDDALAGYLLHEPAEVSLRLNWTEQELGLALRSRPPDEPEPISPIGLASSSSVPSALADMIRDQHADQAAREQARRRAYALSPELVRDLRERGGAVGLELRELEDGLRIEAELVAAIGTT